MATALAAFWHLGQGQVSHDDIAFSPENPLLVAVVVRVACLHAASRFVVSGAEGEADITLFLVVGGIAAIVPSQRLCINWLGVDRRASGGLITLPNVIALPRHEDAW
jgi:hypothetical protein